MPPACQIEPVERYSPDSHGHSQRAVGRGVCRRPGRPEQAELDGL